MFHLARVGLHGCELRARQECKVDVFADHTREHFDHAGHNVIEIQHFGLEHLLAAEGEQLASERCGPLRGALDLLEIVTRGRRVDSVEQHLGMSLHDHQKVIEVMRDAPGEFAHSLHLLGDAELIGKVFAIRDVQTRRRSLRATVRRCL